MKAYLTPLCRKILAYLICMIELACCNGCGFTSYYGEDKSSSAFQNSAASDSIKEKMNLILIEFEPKENYERIVKSSLRELLGSDNDKEGKKYIIMIYTSYVKLMSGIDPSGMSSIYKISMTARFTLLDISNPKCELNSNKNIDEEVNSMAKVQEKRFSSGYDDVENNTLNEGTTENRGRALFYESKLNTVKKTCKMVSTGFVNAAVDFVSNPTLLYGDWANERTSIEIAGQKIAEHLFHKLIGVFSLESKKDAAHAEFEEFNENAYNTLNNSGNNMILP